MNRHLLLTRCTLADATQDGLCDVLLADGKIAAIRQAVPSAEGQRLDAGGRILAPGFIDVHVHGAGGADTLDGTPEALTTMSRTLARLGTTSFVATTAPRPRAQNRHLATAAECVGAPLGGAHLLGLSLEGPFVNPGRRGGLLLDGIAPPSLHTLEELLATCDGTLRLMTVAPELEGCLTIVERLAERDVIPAFGHSNATLDQTRAGLDAGIAHVTHLYNAMPSLHHRAPGPLLEIFESVATTVELVSDGVHVDGRLVRWTYNLLGASRCLCVTDGMRSVGLPDGDYEMYGQPASSRGGTARYADGTLIGTALGLAEIVRRFERFTGCTLAAAIETAALYPARLLGIADRKGRLAVGADADLVLLDEDRTVWATIVAGTPVYVRDEGEGSASRQASS